MSGRFAYTPCVALGIAATPAAAHHGWSYFDTSRVFYLEGQIRSVRWGNPHPEIVLRATLRSEVPDLSSVTMPVAESGLLRTMPALPLPPNVQTLATDATEYVILQS